MSCSDCVMDWTSDRVAEWLQLHGHTKYVDLLIRQHNIDGKALLLMTENDLKSPPINISVLGDVKRLALDMRQLKVECRQSLVEHGVDPHTLLSMARSSDPNHLVTQPYPSLRNVDTEESWWRERELVDGGGGGSSRSSEDGRTAGGGCSSPLKPELWKALIALAYCFLVTWITAFVMVIVHDRVPDMKKYPPLPDIFLDNVPHIPWAFHMCEWVGTLMLFIWLCVLLFHKHRFILLRRFFALSGTVFLLRCVTMLITSLSVPGTHLECNPRPNKLYSEAGLGELVGKMKEAYVIWKGGGMSIQGVRTCGDYMFSGHTVALTMLNFFITEYSPRDIYLLHTFTWLLNMFGIFFILSGHEHYSIDVFIAFYITSRLFLYYHTLANNQSLMQRDSGRTRIWFPLFSFFEAGVDRMVPNEYDSPLDICRGLVSSLGWICRRLVALYRTSLLPGISWSFRSDNPQLHTQSSHSSKKKRK